MPRAHTLWHARASIATNPTRLPSGVRLLDIIPPQFQRVNLKGVFQHQAGFLVGQAKGMVDLGGARPKDAVDQPNGIDRIDRMVVLPGLELAGVQLATVEDHALPQAAVGRQLHLDVVNRPRPVHGLDIEKRQFVLLEILGIKGVVEDDLDNRLLRPEGRVEQVDQAGAVLRRPEGHLEGEINEWVDSKRHGGRRQWLNAVRGSLIPCNIHDLLPMVTGKRASGPDSRFHFAWQRGNFRPDARFRRGRPVAKVKF